MKVWDIKQYFTVGHARVKSRTTRKVYFHGQRIEFDFMVGDTVKHKVHGKGKVARIRNGIMYVVWTKPVKTMFTPKNIPVHLMSGCFPNDLKLSN